MNLHRVVLLSLIVSALASCACTREEPRPNVLFAIADDWSWPHASAYGDPVVRTPSFDRIADEGALFQHAYVSSPSCTPSRGAILTGQYHWRLEGAANLWSVFPDRFTTYPEILEEAGYVVGKTAKAWGPGRTETEGREPAGTPYESFEEFLEQRTPGQPFAFWLGSSDPHRPYEAGSGAADGMDLEAIALPAHFPDHESVRSDVADYYWEVQRFDRLVGAALDALEALGELDNTVVVVTSDNGMPFPRCKSNIYDCGVRVPLAIRWPGTASAGSRFDEFVSLTDLAPSFLEAAGLRVPSEMTGRSLVGLLEGRGSTDRGQVVFGKERHVPAQEAPDMGGYPGRALRTHDYLYIRNYAPERWPAGTPDYENASIPGAWYADTDNSPTKTYIIDNRALDEAHRLAYDLAFAKRSAEELYDLGADPDQLINVAGLPSYDAVLEQMRQRLQAALEASDDPRARGEMTAFDGFEYLGGAPRHPSWQEQQRR